MEQHSLLSNIGLVFTIATVFAFIAKFLKQPLILAYLVAGVVIGPEIGFAWVKDKETIELISEIGLILLLFIIGLEIDLRKLLGAGRTILVTGVSQFLLCVGMGIGLAFLMGFVPRSGNFDWLYLAVTLALSSTLIVVKLLYDKFELTTLPGRITLGVLVFQDIWAIVFLALQPNLHDPRLASIFGSFIKGAGLVLLTLGLSRYALPRFFSYVAKIPELLLIAALAWCFFVSGAADFLGLSREMGALIAGVSMSTFPYNVDVIAKVINIRDFFVTLFFVALGMKIPQPSLAMVTTALGMSLFVLGSRLLAVFPVLYMLGNGLRASLIPSINLAQMSEFSLVIVSLGLTLNHISPELVAALTFVFAITAVLSTYLIAYNHEIQRWLTRLLGKIGFATGGDFTLEVTEREAENSIVFLGCFREASSILHEMELQSKDANVDGLLSQLLVIDFNPLVLQELKRRGIRCLYGDVANMDTLHHAQIQSAKIVACTISDAILRGTTNIRLLQQARRLSPKAQVIAASDNIASAVELYEQGADFVYIARLHSAHYMAELIARAVQDEDGFKDCRENEFRLLKERKKFYSEAIAPNQWIANAERQQQMSNANWRGIVGVVKPTYKSGSLVDFIHLLPDGVGVVPLFIGAREHTEDEYFRAMEIYHRRVGELAQIGVDLIHPEGGPPFMVRGYAAERELVKDWEDEYRIPVVTTGMSQCEALRAMGIKRFLGLTPYQGALNDKFADYFIAAGFDVAAMGGIEIEFSQRYNLSKEMIYRHLKQALLKQPDVDGIYLLSPGAWRTTDVIDAEHDLDVPIVHPVAASVWSVLKHLRVRQPLGGHGRLLEQFP